MTTRSGRALHLTKKKKAIPIGMTFPFLDLVTAATELGHANATTTANIYAHQVARARAEAGGVRAGVFSILKEA